LKTVRAAVHVHSEWSYDARWSLPALADAFAKRRYDAVLMSEHDRGFDEAGWQEYRQACAEASDERILLVPGMEYEDAESVVHVPTWGEELPFLGAARPTSELLREAREAGGFCVLAHPWRRDAFARYEDEWTPLLGAVEIWNRQYDGIAPHPKGLALAERLGLPAFLGLDFHTSRQFFPLALSLDVETPLSAATVVRALHAGRFRAEAFGTSALRFAGGLQAVPLRAAEQARRRVRGPVRSLERRLGRSRP
jgi:predicted metal-dependent phosphoesterase TrpH